MSNLLPNAPTMFVRLIFAIIMRVLALTSFMISVAADIDIAKVGQNFSPLSLVQLGLEDKPIQPSALREAAKKRFMSLMHDAEAKAEHDPEVLKADKVLKDAELKFKTDSHKATDLLASIKTRLAASKAEVTAEEKQAAVEAAEIRKFTERENAKLEATEKKFMELQQKKISSSFAQLPSTIDSSFMQTVKGHDGTKASEEIHAAEKALAELSTKIKNRVGTLTHMLGTPGKQFPGEIVL